MLSLHPLSAIQAINFNTFVPLCFAVVQAGRHTVEEHDSELQERDWPAERHWLGSGWLGEHGSTAQVYSRVTWRQQYNFVALILVWLTCQTPAVGGLIVCVRECVRACVRACVCEWVCVSEDMSPYCSADYETLHVCWVPWCQQCVKFWWWPSDPMKFKKNFYSIIFAVLRTWRSIAVTQSQFLRRLLRDRAQTAAVWKTIPA